MSGFLHLTAGQYRELLAKSGPKAGKRRLKYGNCRESGSDSKLESRYLAKLESLKVHPDAQFRVVEYERQKRYCLIAAANGERAVHYVADFVVTYADGRVEVVDVKSVITRRNPVYVIKRKLMAERLGIKIVEVLSV